MSDNFKQKLPPLPRYAAALDLSLNKITSAFRYSALPSFCNICRRPTVFLISSSNLRENITCPFCGSFTRARLMYYAFSRHKNNGAATIWNMENSGSLHALLLKQHRANYTYSVYCGTGVAPGTMVNGVRHEDVQNTSFPSNHFDFVLSSDVLEHVSSPEKAFLEIGRILKPGGRFIFTLPFLEHQEKSQRRAAQDENGNIVFLMEPQYHDDPLRPEGILVFTLFGWDLLVMANRAGLDCSVDRPYRPCYGIIGPGTIIFTAIKLADADGKTGARVDGKAQE